MTVDAAALERLHARCFETPRPWSEGEFLGYLNDEKSLFVGDDLAFVLGRIILDEVEILTLAVSPELRRQGRATVILSEFERLAALRGGRTCFLEVSEKNAAAILLYTAAGYTESGRRPGYYASKTGPSADAILLAKQLNAS